MVLGLGWAARWPPYTGFQLSQPVWRALGYGAMCTSEVNSHRMKEHATGSLLHIAQVSSPVKPHCLWLAGVGRRLQVERRRKDKARGSIVIREDHDSFLASASSQFIHAHCLAWPAAVATLFSSSIILSSVMTMSLRPLLSLRENHRCGVLPKPAVPVWVAPITSLIWSLASASCNALAADHLVPVLTSGCTWRMTSSGESRSIKWSLAFPTLNSSVMDEKGSWSIPVAV